MNSGGLKSRHEKYEVHSLRIGCIIDIKCSLAFTAK